MRFSVCIPTVRPERIASAVQSVVRQTFQDWELVVVGQGEEGPLRAEVERAAAGDPRVRYRHLNRRGISSARNAGIRESTGEIIASMDDDCEAAPDWLAQLDASFADAGIGLVCGSVVAPPLTSRRLVVCPEIVPADVVYDPAITGSDYPRGFAMLGANFAVRRDVAELVGDFDECLGAGSQFQGGEEHDFLFRLSQAGVRMRSNPAVVMHHTYGARHGVKAVYSYRRERVRGDGAFAAKGAMLATPSGGVPVRSEVVEYAKAQLASVSWKRLPFATFRLFHLFKSFRECLTGYAVFLPAGAAELRAVLVPRPDGDAAGQVSVLLRTVA